MRNSRKLMVLCLVLAVAGLAAGALLSVAMRTTGVAGEKSLAVSDTQPRRPSPQSVSRWLRASNDVLAARAADYEIDAPRRRDSNGQALPFRRNSIGAEHVRALREAGDGAVVPLSLFPDVSFEVRVTGVWNSPAETKILASLSGRPPGDRFSMAWTDDGARGLIELPSRNLAYEIVAGADGVYAVREWLFTDVVCARLGDSDGGAAPGIPPSPASPEPVRTSAIAPGEVPILNSRPSAVATIYLDFDGEVVSGTAWAGGNTINALAARMNAAQVEETWSRVSKHFGIFDVNVTTDRAVYDAAPANRRTQCVITSTTDAAPGAGGVAYLDSFRDPGTLYKICWTFDDQNPDGSALITSHEVGHTLNLNHDGRLAAGSEAREEYYLGHGTGTTGWGPFMGAPYGKSLLQWSRGEYLRANNPEDDLAIMSDASRIPFLPDDHGGTSIAATGLLSGVATNGMVDRNTDADFFRVLIGSGPQPVTVSLPVGTMLDVVLNVFAEDGTLLETVNPAGELAASTTLNFPTARNVFLAIAGTGKPEVLETGYSAYSSLGSYTLLAGSPLPEQVTGLTATPVSDSAVDLFWSAAPAAASYVVRRDGADVTNTAATSFRNTGLSESTSYTFEIVATNGTGAAPASDPATATTLSWLAANPYGLRVTNPSSLTTTDSGNFVFSGQMGAGLIGSLVQWTNVGRSASGFVSSPGTNWSQQIPLLSGTNRILFSTSYALVTGTNTSAYDGAGDWAYQSQGWTTGANGGSGFGAWSNSVTGANATLEVTDEWAATNMHVGTFYGFSLRAGGGAFAFARRPFLQPLQIGDAFTVNFDSNLLDAGRTVGISLTDAGGANRFTFFARGGTPNIYGIRDGAGTNTNTGIGYTTNGLLPLTFTMLTSNSYRFTAGTNTPITNNLAPGGAISLLVASNASAGSGPDNAFFLGDMSIYSLLTTNQSVLGAAPSVIRPAGASTDGIPDVWWDQHGVPANWRLAAADADGDGQTNASEYAAGTSPVSAASRFHIVRFSRPGAQFEVTWSSVPGRSYQVQTSSGLVGGSWTTVATVPADGIATETSYSVPAGDGPLFLRVLTGAP